MKFIKSLLLTTTVLAALSVDASAREGTYLGAQVGAAAPKHGKTTVGQVNWKANGGFSQSNKWDWHGGVFATHEWIQDPHAVLGVTLGFNMENTKSKQKTTFQSGPVESTVKRKYVVNLLGKAGYADFHKQLLPYVTAGVAVTRFRFDVNQNAGASDTNQSKTTLGWAGGVGLDYMINNTTDVGIQYLYTWYGNTKKVLGINGTNTTIFAPKGYHAATFGVRVKI